MKDNPTKSPSCNGCYWQGNCDGTFRCDHFSPLNIDPLIEAEYQEYLAHCDRVAANTSIFFADFSV